MPFPNIGAPELILILVIALIVLGPGKLPEVAASIGKSFREFRRAASDVSDATRLESTGTASPAAPAPPAPNALSTTTEPNRLTGTGAGSSSSEADRDSTAS